MSNGWTKLERDFYKRDPAEVARDLVGKVLVRKLGNEILSGKIVETEAYYGEGDPASRAYRGRKNYNSPMFGEPGRLFVYMVHTWWLLNIVAHRDDEVGAVLIRALEPIEGISTMMSNRGEKDIREITNGPGKLARALSVTNRLNDHDITRDDSELMAVEGEKGCLDVGSSGRIGVARDLPKELRFYLKQNKFVSK